jgi:FAD/FMN-containing dehydrogenase
VGADQVVTDAAVAASFAHDLTGRFSGRPLLVVRPAHTGEVSAVLRSCARAAVAVIPQGGHSGMAGGGTPRDGEVVLSLRRLQGIEPLDQTAQQITVGAGVTLEALQEHLRPFALALPVDHGARSAATIGGMAATNAGGALAFRHGMMRAHVRGLEVVLADGRVISRLSGLLKDNSGYDLTSLLIGSEGTLGVITRVRLGLERLLPRRATALLALPDIGQALEVLRLAHESVPSLQAIDFFELRGLRRVCAHLNLPAPFRRDHEVYLIVDCAARSDPSEELEVFVGVVEDALVATDLASRRRLWLYRDGQNETVNALGVPHKLDVAVPVSLLPRFLGELRVRVAEIAPAAELIVYGHLGDGNVHVNILGPPVEDVRVDVAVLELATALGGSISAEHGIGLAKRGWLPLARTETELALMRALKDAFDPAGLLNPDRILPDLDPG